MDDLDEDIFARRFEFVIERDTTPTLPPSVFNQSSLPDLDGVSDLSDTLPPGFNEPAEEGISEIRARAREPRQNSPPDSPGIPESESSSSSESENDVTEDFQCKLCASGREIAVQFKSCPHALCTKCMKNLWWSRVRYVGHRPIWFPCPWCRAEIMEIGMLSQEVPLEAGSTCPGEVIVHADVSLTVRAWEYLVGWMTLRSKRMAQVTARYDEYESLSEALQVLRNTRDWGIEGRTVHISWERVTRPTFTIAREGSRQ